MKKEKQKDNHFRNGLQRIDNYDLLIFQLRQDNS